MIKFKRILFKVRDHALKHKVISVAILLLVICFGYLIYSRTSSSSETRYVVSAVERGTIVSTVSGTGQVSALNQIDLKPKASGEIVYLGVKTGDYVEAGTLLLKLDASDAEIDLKSAKLNLQKLIEGNSSSLGGNSGLAKNYEDGFSNVSATFSDLSDIMIDLDTILNNYQSSTYKINLPDTTATSYYNKAVKSFYAAKDSYNQALTEYRALNRPLTNDSVAKIIDDTYVMLQSANQMIKDANTYIAYTYNKSESNSRIAAMTNDKESIATWTKTISSDYSAVGTSRDTLKDSALGIETQQLSLQQKQQAYNDYFLYAPISGLVQIDVNRNAMVNSGASVGTLVSNQKIATVSLNEVDIAKVKVGQKANLTFDAAEDLPIEGLVTEVDVVGTVSQGVVSYNVKITFDTNDSRIKSGMSVTADIIVESHDRVVVVPSGAVKTKGDTSYVESLGDNQSVTSARGVTSTQTPVQITVTTGLADDTNVEVLSGLKEGDKIITQTITASASSKSANSLTSLLGMGRRQTTTKSSNSTKSTSSSNKTSSTNSRSSGPAVGSPHGF